MIQNQFALKQKKILNVTLEQFGNFKNIESLLKENIEFNNYLKNTVGWINPSFKIVHGRMLGGGDVNLIFQYLLENADEPKNIEICLKKYLPFRKDDLGYSFPEFLRNRGFYEFQFSKILTDLIKDCKEIGVINIISYDSQEEIAIMPKISDLIRPYINMLDEEISLTAAQNLGKALAVIQNKSFNANLFLKRPGIHEEHLRYRLDVASKIIDFPKDSLLLFLSESGSIGDGIIVLDSFSPKNVLVNSQGEIVLIDFEFSNFGDPAFDLGHMLGYFYFQKFISPDDKNTINKIMKLFLSSYKTHLHDDLKNDIENIEFRATKYLGITLLYRAVKKHLDKKNPVVIKINNISEMIFNDKFNNLKELLENY